jgi:NADPH2:quinone reductase
MAVQHWQITGLGHPPILGDGPEPTPAPGQARVRVAACGVNFADLLMIEGRYQERRPVPFTLGLECSGVVDALGPGAAGPAVGTRVLALTPGAMAEAVCVSADHLLPIPAAMTFAQGAGFPVAYGTSHLALDHRAQLQAGETLLVTGASGGVGLTAVELGVRMGARVIALARGADKLAVARAAGAHDLLDSDTADLRDALRSLGGCDVVYDTVGGALFDPALRSLRPEGRYLAIGFASGTVPQVPANLLLVKNLSVIGLYWGGYLTFRPQVLTRSLTTLLDWFANGSLHPQISHILPFHALSQGLDLLRSRTATGKVVLTVP